MNHLENQVKVLANLVHKRGNQVVLLKNENKKLRQALAEYVYETTHLSPEEEDGSHWCRINSSTLQSARKLLKT